MPTPLDQLLDAADLWEECARLLPGGPWLAPVIERGRGAERARAGLEQALGRWLDAAGGREPEFPPRGSAAGILANLFASGGGPGPEEARSADAGRASVASDADKGPAEPGGHARIGEGAVGVPTELARVEARLGPWGAVSPEGPRGGVWEDLRLALLVAAAQGEEAGAGARRLAPRVRALGRPLGAFAGAGRERLLGAALALAEAPDAGAARLAVRLAPAPGPLLERFRGLAEDLAAAWARARLDEGRPERVLEAAREGLGLPRATLFEARRRAGQPALAWAGLFPLPADLDAVRLWDEAQAAGELELLRAAARESGDRLGAWLAADEATLCVLPEQRYDHEQVKAVTAYAVARLGLPPGPARSARLPEDLLTRLALAPGPHDPVRCLEVALAGYERLVAFHVAGRSRARYARAGAYWRAHAALCAATGHPERHAVLGARFAEELARLPALRADVEGR